MKKHLIISFLAFLAFGLLAPLNAQDAAEAGKAPAKPSEQEQLAKQNALAEEKLKAELSELKAEVARIKLEKEAIAERLSLQSLKLRVKDEERAALANAEKSRAAEEATVAKARAEALTAQLKAEKAELSLKVARLESDLKLRQAEKRRKSFADREPEYLEDPLKKDGTLVISDRRITFNGAVTYDSANYITERIHFYNNADSTKPIFLVIDYSPGGSVMAGYRILRAMETSKAPVYVVVKSFAASMAAAITTLAEKSYCYPNAVILHHQISSTTFGSFNLTEQKELYENSKKWWDRLAGPIAEKMGITLEEFIEQMYANASDGDWTEFGTEAQKLKWVDHTVERIDESSIARNPDLSKASSETSATHRLKEELDSSGRPVMFLPRLKPVDVYWLTNPDRYYRLR